MAKLFFFRCTIFLILLCCISACNKIAVHKVNSSFIGNWKHQENSNEKWYLEINDDSYGNITLYDSTGNHIIAYGENPKKWRINESKQTLYHGTKNKKFHIDKYPTIASQDIYNGIDTITLGKTYIILDGDYFVKL